MDRLTDAILSDQSSAAPLAPRTGSLFSERFSGGSREASGEADAPAMAGGRIFDGGGTGGRSTPSFLESSGLALPPDRAAAFDESYRSEEDEDQSDENARDFAA